MIKNVKLKKVLIKGVFPVISVLNKFIKKRDNEIFLYCANDTLSDNTEALFDYLITNKYNEKYNIVCGVKTPRDYNNKCTKNVQFISKSKCVYQYLKSKYVFYSFGKLPIKPAKNQCVINLWHGIPIKTIGMLSKINNGDEFFFTYVCASSDMYRSIMAKAFDCPEENVLICGEPKTDKLFECRIPRKNKLIVWTPTFRQSSFLGYNDSDNTSLLPLFNDDEWNDLNNILCQNNVEMIVKLHPLQDIDDFNYCKLSNLEIYSDKTFIERSMNLYSLLAQSDALISDYSSVYLEYLVLNRPICFTIEDINEYSDNRGFVFDKPLDYMPGMHINNKNGLYEFIEQISINKDEFKEKREAIDNLVNKFKDGNNCKRILDFCKIEI